MLADKFLDLLQHSDCTEATELRSQRATCAQLNIKLNLPRENCLQAVSPHLPNLAEKPAARTAGAHPRRGRAPLREGG